VGEGEIAKERKRERGGTGTVICFEGALYRLYSELDCSEVVFATARWIPALIEGAASLAGMVESF